MRVPFHLVVLLMGASVAAPTAARERADPLETLAQADADRDGVVSRAEFVDARRARFAQMDRNGDGSLSVDDLPRLMRRRAGDRVDQPTQRFDADRDGRLSRDEFVNGPARLFDLGDANGDERIDRSEMDRLRAAAASGRAGPRRP
jgi:Ca2+-binding EF-hand superfamily protein